MTKVKTGRPMVWNQDSIAGQVLRDCLLHCDTWTQIASELNRRLDINISASGARAAAWRQGISLVNRDQALTHEDEIKKKYKIDSVDSIPNYTLRDDREWVPIIFFSDMHVGSAGFLEDVLDVYLDFGKELQAYWIGVGDFVEGAVPTHMPQTMWGQVMTPEEQVKYLERKFKTYGMDERSILTIAGNHENRTAKLTSFHPLRMFAREMNSLYMPRGAYININMNNVSYSVVVKHGLSTSQNHRVEVEKWATIYPEADVVAMGHIHKLDAFDCNEHFQNEFELDENGSQYVKSRKRVSQLGMRCGHSLAYQGYVEERPYKPNRTGFPIVWFNQYDKQMVPDISGNFTVME